ncbi:hypothetical protein PG994_005829 [Apiospora phragmitis]|uniref:FAD-binding domain-containing protein n=1 Tax=Apiospora phragmitis TaxID=2905665 RepID=A0ABR1VH48_9PEZI
MFGINEDSVFTKFEEQEFHDPSPQQAPIPARCTLLLLLPAFPSLHNGVWKLLASVPPERMHVSKKLERVERSNGEDGFLTLCFTDGSSHECDVLVGTDGIRSILLCDKVEQPAIYLWEHPTARTHVSGPICVLGDAAHATTPYKGSGAGISIEDRLILFTLLGGTTKPREALKALRVYDQVRRPRMLHVVEASKGTGDFILDFDVEQHLSDALKLMAGEMEH